MGKDIWRNIIARYYNRFRNRPPRVAHLVNGNIPFFKVIVIDDKNQQLGIMNTRDAIILAKEKEMDLVMIHLDPKKPIAKILDYGKFKYLNNKKKKNIKAKQVTINNREIKLSLLINEHDLNVKIKKTRKLLLDNDRVKVSIRFKGREIVRQELGYKLLENFFKKVEDIAIMTKKPQLNLKFLSMYLEKNSKVKTEISKELNNAKNEN